jgi:hypothetical protein
MARIIQAGNKVFPDRNSRDTAPPYAASHRISKGNGMKNLLQRGWRSWIAARQRRADAIVLEHLDARMLKDIGFELWDKTEDARHPVLQRRNARTWRAWRAALEPLGGFK